VEQEFRHKLNIQFFSGGSTSIATGNNTRIADVIVPEVFNNYVVQRSVELSRLVQSEIIQADSAFDALAATGGRTINMPFWNDLTGDDEVLSDGDKNLTPEKITSGQDVAVLQLRGKAWRTNDLAKALSGDDPMARIGDLVASYWNRMRQRTLIAELKGIETTLASTNVLDVSVETGEDSLFTGATFLDATHKLGDHADMLVAIAMHSATYTELRKRNLIEFALDSNNQEIPTYQGKQVIIDDLLTPDENGVYTSYLFARGAFALGNGSAPVPTETTREVLAGNDILVNRQHFLLHPRGIAFTSSSVAGQAPTNTELATAANWNRVYDPKWVHIVIFKHRNTVAGG
jgi:hypothetical protein